MEFCCIHARIYSKKPFRRRGNPKSHHNTEPRHCSPQKNSEVEIFLTILFFIPFQPCMCGSLLIRCRRRGGCYQIQITLFAFPLCFFPSRNSLGAKNFSHPLLIVLLTARFVFTPVRDFFHMTYPSNIPKGWGKGGNFCSDICESRRLIRKVKSCKSLILCMYNLTNSRYSPFKANIYLIAFE